MQYILTIDQGTTSTRALLVNEKGEVVNSHQLEHKQIYPKPGYVEHDPEEIWINTQNCCLEVVKDIDPKLIKSIGITNQRETVVAWDSLSGQSIENAIVWQCRRTAGIVDDLVSNGYNNLFRQKTGLVLDAYFSGTKIKWLIDNSEAVQTALKNETLRFGTIDSFLIFKMSGKHITDVSNASRTLLFNINALSWDEELLNILDVPKWTLPEVVPSSFDKEGVHWNVGDQPISINGIAGDQQSALFGQHAFSTGDTKVTYGTGSFALTNIGKKAKFSDKGLLTTVAWSLDKLENVSYAFEGSIFITGALIQWLRDELQIINSAPEVEELAKKADNIGSLVIVPGFVGLGAPYWDQQARGAILGMTRGTNRSHLALASLESIALQTVDIISLLEEEADIKISEIQVDGGASTNDLLMQIQANMLQTRVSRPKNIETTALGVTLLAGLGSKLWEKLDEIKKLNPTEKTFSPDPSFNYKFKLDNWKKAIQRSLNWED